MSMDRQGGVFIVDCALCENDFDTGESDFNDALRAKKDEGWTSRKVDGEWCDICPDCTRGAR